MPLLCGCGLGHPRAQAHVRDDLTVCDSNTLHADLTLPRSRGNYRRNSSVCSVHRSLKCLSAADADNRCGSKTLEAGINYISTCPG